jgi:hypothetical protein
MLLSQGTANKFKLTLARRNSTQEKSRRFQKPDRKESSIQAQGKPQLRESNFLAGKIVQARRLRFLTQNLRSKNS